MLVTRRLSVVKVLTALVVANLLLMPEGHAEGTYKMNTHAAPEITLFHPHATVSVGVEKVKPTTVNGNFFSICSGGRWVIQSEKGRFQQKRLADFMTPKAGKCKPDEYNNFVTLEIEQNKLYIFRIPLGIAQDKDPSSSDSTASFAIRPENPFPDNCTRTSGVEQEQVDIKLPIRSLADSTPDIQPLDWQDMQLQSDGKNFTARVRILGAVPGNQVLWVDDKHPQGLAMTRGEVLLTPSKQPVGAIYSASLPVPTRLQYTASVKVIKQVNFPAKKEVTTERQVVNTPTSKPYFKLFGCTEAQCTFLWNSDIPYRDDNGSLGLNLGGGIKPLEGSLPPAIFTLQPNSWENTGRELFAGQKDDATLLSASNWQQFQNNHSSFLTSAPMPHYGVFILRFETRSP
jgi:hypothetical protein